ncbi:MAG: PAS domain-containing protein [Candidatus Eremiobacteraeota bacterium]|nr:PAS domain-containing protein [Candidatus Eremiobacteraeota bacterium]MBV8720511.1 PAS domain-containing protein [Candidatus Eremiobacteraeota bacterium]
MADGTTTDAAVLQPNLALVLERITDGFFALDADWRIAYMNAEARRLLHVESDPIGRVWLEAFPKARGRLFEREYSRAMREQTPVQFVEYSATAECWFEVKAYPSADGLSVYFRDVSSRIEAQREVERNARRQRAIIDFGRSVLGGLSFEELLADAIDLLRDVLEAPIVEIYSYDRLRGRLVASGVVGWNPGASLDAFAPELDHLEHALRTGEPFVSGDLRVDPRARTMPELMSNGVRACICALVGTPADPKGMIVVYATTSRTFAVGDVRFVESLAQTIAEASSSIESSRRMRQVVETVRDGFVSFDRDLRITYANERFARFWGRTPETMIGESIAIHTDPLGDTGGRVYRALLETLQSQQPATIETQYRDRWHELRMYPFSDGVAAYVRDITRRKTEEQRIRDLNAELEARVAERTKQLQLANKELESFSYSVSHDLRAPLRAIDGFSQALVEDYGEQLDERAQNYLDRVRKAAQRMASLIDALLQLAKVARAAVTYTRVDLTAIARSFAEELHDRDPERRVEFAIEPALVALGEPNLLRAVLENLMGNAWKFTRKTENPRISVGRTDAGGEFFVRDNGAGFDMAYGNKLFGAFQRLHANEEFEGTGIGLATVARIVHRHGGTIRAEGETGKGATFYFSLPHRPDGVE